MSQPAADFGISTALATPFSETGAIDPVRLGRHAVHVLRNGADSVTLFGTTGEGASIGMTERGVGIHALSSAGCPAEKTVLGVSATSLSDAVSQVLEGSDAGIARFLVLPPYYFKDASDQALFDWYATLLNRTPNTALFILYHIPQVSQVPLSVDLVQRLAAYAPERIIGIKDSSGNWENAEALIRTKALPVLVGDERLLHRARAIGGAGTISGVANLYPDRLRRIFDSKQEDKWLSDHVTAIVSQPVLPAIKALVAEKYNDPVWARMRLPLEPLASEQHGQLLAATADLQHG